MNKICKRCNVEKPITDFSKDVATYSGYKSTCKECKKKFGKKTKTSYNKSRYLSHGREWYLKNKERILRYTAARKKGKDLGPYRKTTPEIIKMREENRLNKVHWKKYKERAWRKKGIKNFTYAQYEELVALQGNKCYLCGSPPLYKGKGLCIDHNHKTGKVRKLLCFNCNTSIGKLGDNIAGIERVLKYLREHDER